MKKFTIINLLILMSMNMLFGQNNQDYYQLVKEAKKLYENKDYLLSAKKYSEEFVAIENQGFDSDMYNAARAWAMAGQMDSSFVQLFLLIENRMYSDIARIKADKDLEVLHSDERWNKIIESIKQNIDKTDGSGSDKFLVAVLDTIYQDDQIYRIQLDVIEQKYGWNSKEAKDQWKIIEEKDSINTNKVTKILDEYGWLGNDVVGYQGNSALFLVIQHSELKIQEKYLPMMREAVKKGNAQTNDLAFLEDRAALGKGEKQIYGSQIGQDPETNEYFILPLIDPDNVDKRRAEVGLETIQSYISYWGMTWNAEEYKMKLLQIETKQKK